MARGKPVLDAPALPTLAQWDEHASQMHLLNPEWQEPRQLCVEDIAEWQEVAETLRKLKAKEAKLRKKVIDGLFLNPEEGTNKVRLADGSIVEGKKVVNRKIDEVKLDLFKKYKLSDMKSLFVQLDIDCDKFSDDTPVTEVLKLQLDDLINWKPSLSLSEYRKLTVEQATIFEQVLDIEPGSMSIDIKSSEKE